MPSPRRPTYTSTGRRPGGAGTRPGHDGQDAGSSHDVISASRAVPEPAPQPTGKARKATFGGRAKEKPAGPSSGSDSAGNVLAFPEPKGKRRKRNVLVVAFTVVAIVAGLLAAAVFSPALAVRTITVSGTHLLTPAQVEAALEPLRGRPLPQVTDEEVGRLLGPLVQVKSVSAEARPPSGLAVAVRERVPVALVKQGEQYQLVDVEGVQLAATDDPASVSLPVIDGGAGTIGKDLFRATAEVLGALPADVLAKLSNASAQSVDAVELKLVDGQSIIWGNAGEKELKAKVLAALLKVPADPKNPVRVYDVSVPRHPVTR
ncbi:Cell division FtsQ family protein [Arthrobacter sp. 9AX]|uniref:cell division protein FtsQ/DivIB n=1 Tax=Arthrobacter sp. 9AX TaxID=2653131 RepID=UPI0012EF9CE6|nr:cell division protein FtsQ/DivIB [Arthrobacter sp. 9AX]VXB12230.1 Cell division FtsQ family protein [Arthrobacter sp. 9AX]